MHTYTQNNTNLNHAILLHVYVHVLATAINNTIKGYQLAHCHILTYIKSVKNRYY